MLERFTKIDSFREKEAYYQPRNENEKPSVQTSKVVRN